MATVSIKLNWTFEHFLTYVLFVVAGADMNVDENELSEIKEIITNNNDTTISYEQLADDVKKILMLQPHIEEKEAFIKENKHLFLTNEDKKDFFIDCIENVIVADLHIDEGEFLTYRTIKKSLTE